MEGAMKKLYIILAVVFVCISVALIYFGNTSSNPDDATIREKIRLNIKEKGLIRPDRVFGAQKIHKQMDKDAIKRMIMIRNKDKKLKIDKENNSTEEQKKTQPVESAEKQEKK